MAIHSILSTIMGAKRINQKQLAEKTGLSRTTINALYNDKYLDYRVLNEICKALDCDVSDILKYIPDEDEKTDNA